MFSDARKAYDRGTKSSESSRDLEAAALFKAARLLEACQQTWNDPDLPTRLGEALRYNQRLWTLFQVELARENHTLEKDLRVNLLRLSAFVDRRTFDLLARPDRHKVQALIDVNRNIAAGLAARTEEDGEEKAA